MIEKIKNCLDTYKQITDENIVNQIITDIFNDKKRDIVTPKGWVCSAFYICFETLLKNMNYQDSMDYIINHKGSDTDTNAAITGALIGGMLGYKK